MFLKQYPALALALAATALAAGCASGPQGTAPQASAQPDQRAPCEVRTGSNYCRRDGGSSADVKAMSGDQARQAADEMRVINIPGRGN